MPIIFHIDLDAFFASCEKARRPELADRPVVVCVYSGRGKDSGAVSAASYDAREYGIHAGMPIRQARSIAAETDEDVAFIGADKEYYTTVSNRIHEILAAAADDTEQASVDEAYADMSGIDGYDAARDRAASLQAEIEEAEDVTASIGVGPNKLVAKIASDRDKPEGITVVRPPRVEEFLAPLPVDELHGVGPKTAETLAEMEVSTVAELREVARPRLVEAFGNKKGVSLYRKARGQGATELEEQEPEQLSRLTTLQEDTRDLDVIDPVLQELATAVMERVEERGWRYSTVSALVVTAELDMRTRSTSFKTSQDSAETLYETARELLQDFLGEHPDTAVRRVGVRASGFEKGGQETLDSSRFTAGTGGS
ncbi:MAG: DNA polymerase IV [Candidatus Nanohaloarchaea archaeon]|nr:DNA polymerase IV [Candidatus Nanohaloarchaea archaeon]